jgi:hypothetical protein
MGAMAEAVARQFGASWAMWRDAITRFPDDGWRCAERAELCPARWAYHAIQAVDFHCGPSPEGFDWSRPFGVNWATNDASALPDKVAVLAYLAEIEGRVDAWVRTLDDAELLEQGSWPWRPGGHLLGHLLYVLRHTHHHLGEVCLLLRERGIEQPDWASG